MPILTAGLLINSTPQNGANNPWELHHFTFPIVFTPPPAFCEHVKWEMSGDYPKGLKIDSTTGIISGKVKHFGEQPSCKGAYPKEDVKIDGSNYLNNGRFMGNLYDFIFEVERITKTSLPNPSNGNLDCTSTEETSETSVVTIRVVKNYSIDNFIWKESYTKQNFPLGETSNPKPIVGI